MFYHLSFLRNDIIPIFYKQFLHLQFPSNSYLLVFLVDYSLYTIALIDLRSFLHLYCLIKLFLTINIIIYYIYYTIFISSLLKLLPITLGPISNPFLDILKNKK